MGDEKQNEEDHVSPRHNHVHFSWETANGHGDSRKDKRQKHSPMHSSVKRQMEVATMPGLINFQNPGIKPPGIFFDPYIPAWSPTIPINGIVPDSKTDIDQFHNSDSEEDIFTLFNACDGEIDDGYLDIRKLDELSKEEREVLNIERLRKIWLHTTTGCAICAGIVRTLNSARGMFGDIEEDLDS